MMAAGNRIAAGGSSATVASEATAIATIVQMTADIRTG